MIVAAIIIPYNISVKGKVHEQEPEGNRTYSPVDEEFVIENFYLTAESDDMSSDISVNYNDRSDV